MKIPFIVIPSRENQIPFLVSSTNSELFSDPIILTSRGKNLRDAKLFSVDGVYRIDNVLSSQKASFWNLLLHRNQPDFWNLSILTSRVGDLDVSSLIHEFEKSIEELPEDVWMQYHEKDVVLYLLKNCKNIEEIITVCCLIGIFEAESNQLELPEIHDNSDEYNQETTSEIDYIMGNEYNGKLSRKNISLASKKIIFKDLG